VSKVDASIDQFLNQAIYRHIFSKVLFRMVKLLNQGFATTTELSDKKSHRHHGNEVR